MAQSPMQGQAGVGSMNPAAAAIAEREEREEHQRQVEQLRREGYDVADEEDSSSDSSHSSHESYAERHGMKGVRQPARVAPALLRGVGILLLFLLTQSN